MIISKAHAIIIIIIRKRGKRRTVKGLLRLGMKQTEGKNKSWLVKSDHTNHGNKRKLRPALHQEAIG
jgi:hypothetical protein